MVTVPKYSQKLIHRANFCGMFMAHSFHLLIHITNFISLQYLLSSKVSYGIFYFIALPLMQISFQFILWSCCIDHRFHSVAISIKDFISFAMSSTDFISVLCYIYEDFISITTSYHRYHFITLPIFTTDFTLVYFMITAAWSQFSFSGYFYCRFHFVGYVHHRLTFS